MSRAAEALPISPGQRETLEVLARSTTSPHREVRRAQALLLAADGAANVQIAAAVGGDTGDGAGVAVPVRKGGAGPVRRGARGPGA